MHISCEVLSSVGISASITVGAPGTHGATVAGMHGIGVSTPRAAAVAGATLGFAGDMHLPNGMMLTIGMLSIMLASGISLVNTLLVGSTTSELGAMPKLHIIVAPIQTCIGIAAPRAVLAAPHSSKAVCECNLSAAECRPGAYPLPRLSRKSLRSLQKCGFHVPLPGIRSKYNG